MNSFYLEEINAFFGTNNQICLSSFIVKIITWLRKAKNIAFFHLAQKLFQTPITL